MNDKPETTETTFDVTIREIVGGERESVDEGDLRAQLEGLNDEDDRAIVSVNVTRTIPDEAKAKAGVINLALRVLAADPVVDCLEGPSDEAADLWRSLNPDQETPGTFTLAGIEATIGDAEPTAARNYERPDSIGYVYTVTVDGQPALEDLHMCVPFCADRKSADFTDYQMAISAMQGLSNAMADGADIALKIKPPA